MNVKLDRTGSYFCWDSPGALQNHFENDLNMTTTEFSLIYSICSWPNVVLGIFGGFLLDRTFGIRRGAVIYSAITLIGHLIFAEAVYLNAFWLMLIGRFIYGYSMHTLSFKNYTPVLKYVFSISLK